ncbi:hypothetical protein [Pseudomonas putida]|uniref:hypothetical protein n=1 Tax=Pseudomonas putida TaxID=303 RepID=UPI0023662A32|nr:hypothetical protein [Pseudomonas putida]MDD2047849.1 hypothetical protein [Pseudomonas putida]
MEKVAAKITGVKDQFGRTIENGDHNVRASNVFIVSGTTQVFNGSTPLGETQTQWAYQFNVALNERYSLGVEANDPKPFTFTLTQLAP